MHGFSRSSPHSASEKARPDKGLAFVVKTSSTVPASRPIFKGRSSAMIKFTPLRGHILMCDYDMANVPPEMEKMRRAVVISPRSYNHPHGKGPGRCLVVPFSATDPEHRLTPADVPFPVGQYRSLTQPTWAICSAVMSVSHARLDRVQVRQGRWHNFLTETLSPVDMLRIEEGLRHATGVP